MNKIEYLKIKELSESISHLINVENSCEDDNGDFTLDDLNSAWNRLKDINEDIIQIIKNIGSEWEN